MTESKKAWVTPELIVLVRSNPEEAVLGGCKAGTGGSDSLGEYARCSIVLNCNGCLVYATS
jgi:hypothetical protein